MKIGIICPYELPVPAVRGGAVETLVEQLIRNNEQEKMDITIFSIYDDQAEKKTCVYPQTKFIFHKYEINEKYHIRNAILRKLKLPVRIHPAITVLHKNDICDFDIIIIENDMGSIIPLRKKYKGIILLHSHSDSIVGKRDAELAMNACDGVIFVSKFLQSKFSREFPQVKSFVLWNGIDLSRFDIKKRCVFDEGEPIRIGYVGRITKEKGVDLFLKAISNLHSLQLDDNLEIVLIGSSHFQGSQKTPFMNQIDNIISENSLSVKFTGYVDHDKIPNQLGRCDIVVVPSQCNEALPLVVAEAMAMGCHVLASNIGGIPEMIQNEQNLIPLGANYAECLTEKLASLIKLLNVSRKALVPNATIIAENFNGKDYLKRLRIILEKYIK